MRLLAFPGCLLACAYPAWAAPAVTASDLRQGQASAAISPYDRDNLYPSAVLLYGRVSAGLRRVDAPPQRLDIDPCPATGPAPATYRGWKVDSVERSRWGLKSTEVLDGGHRAHFQLEQSVGLDSGDLRGPCQLMFDARATVGLSDRRWGRLDLGRTDQPAWLLSLRADPWGGNGTASPDWRSYVAPERGGNRSDGSITYQSPETEPVQLSLQTGRPLLSDTDRHGWGVSLAWDRLPWLVGVAWQTWPGNSWAVPLVAVHDTGTWRLSGAVTLGRVTGTNYTNVFVGLSWPGMGKGDPERHEWRAGLNLHRVEAGAAGDWQSDLKLGAGWRYRFSKQTWVALGGAWVRPQQGPGRAVFDVSLTYSFERNLRTPQWPR